jgi:hypothetical protein
VSLGVGFWFVCGGERREGEKDKNTHSKLGFFSLEKKTKQKT